jgi:hypothetical protein
MDEPLSLMNGRGPILGMWNVSIIAFGKLLGGKFTREAHSMEMHRTGAR